MLYAGLDLSRKRLDFHLLDSEGATVEVGAAPPDADGLRGLTQRLDRHREPIRAAIESMNGARFVHDRLELAGWQVEIADAQNRCGRSCRQAAPVPSPSIRRRLASRVPCHGSGRARRARSWRPRAELDREIGGCERELRRLGADHRYVPLLCTVPGISWVLAYTIAAEIGDIDRFPTPRKLAGYSGLCPRVYQSGERDLRGSLAKQGPKYLRWALVEAATHACTAAIYRDRYQHTKARIGKQRGAKVAQVDLARRLAEAIWHMLSRDEPFAPKGATDPLAA
jgi:Transposase IS116/IS110/IS902 family